MNTYGSVAYIVPYLSGTGLNVSEFTNYEEALAFVESVEEKAYIIRVEAVNTESFFTVDCEPHT